METNYEKPASPGLIIAGFIFGFLGGLVGLLIGYVLWKGTNIVDGEKKFKYDEASRKKGMYIFVLSIVMIVIYVGMR
jgi:hypothetical protein